jgi:hypothetical protein
VSRQSRLPALLFPRDAGAFEMKWQYFAATALLSSTIMSSPAFAATVGTATVEDPIAQGLSPDNLVAAQAQCTALAAAHAPAVYTGTLDVSSIVPTLTSGPTEVDPTARDKTNIVGTGTFTPASTYIVGDPFRIGGSVNMFGDQYADSGRWSDSEYDFSNEFTSTFSYAFNCNMTESVHNAGTGHHDWTLDPSDPQAAACLAYDRNGLFQGEDQGQCVWIVDTPASDTDEARPAEAGTPISQDQTDTLSGHEYHGGPVEAEGGTFHIGQVVICISPSKPTPGGTWRTQNGYTGSKCTTDWFKNHAVWGSGTESSNGTYISVPDYN